MAELVQLIPVEDEETDRKILEMRVSGSSVHHIAQQLMVPRHEVSKRLDRNLPQIDASFRRRAIALSLLRLDELTETFQKQAKGGCSRPSFEAPRADDASLAINRDHGPPRGRIVIDAKLRASARSSCD